MAGNYAVFYLSRIFLTRKGQGIRLIKKKKKLQINFYLWMMSIFGESHYNSTMAF